MDARRGDRSVALSGVLAARVMGALCLASWSAFAGQAQPQPMQVLVTEVRGDVVKLAGKTTQPLRSLDTLKPGERITLAAEARVGIFVDDLPRLYVVDGPAKISVTSSGLVATAGTLPVPRKLDPAFRGIKLHSEELFQASLAMRTTNDARLISPEGFVSIEEARRLRWKAPPGPWIVELATEWGRLLYRADFANGQGDVPPEVMLKAGERYVWGISRPGSPRTPVDWTEFVIRDESGLAGTLPQPSFGTSASDRALYALWLRKHEMPRAAMRALIAQDR